MARWALAGSLAVVSIACGTGAPSATGAAGAAGAAGAMGAAGSAGTQGAIGGAAAAGSGPPAGSGGGGIAGSGGLAPGTCGIHRRISLPSAPPSATAAVPTVVAAEPDRFVQRVAGGFAVGPWRDTTQTPARLNWLRVDPDGATQTPYSAQSSVVGLQSFNMATPSRVVLVAQYDFSEFRTAIVEDAGTITWGAAKLFAGEDTKFNVARGAASLDGQRGLVMLTDAQHPPWLVMFAADGTSIGDVLQTTASGTCYSVVPTARGAAFTSIEGATFHLIERSAAGTTALDVAVPIVRAQANDCPALALTDDGFAFLVFETTDGTIGWTLHRIARDGTTSVERWDALLDCKSVALAVKGDAAIATCATTSETRIVKRTEGRDQTFAIEHGGTQIHSEPGSLFLNVTHPQPGDGTVVPREIVEIRCTD